MSSDFEIDAKTVSDKPELGIGVVSRMTDISQHVLRVWERRYNVVDAQRTDSGRRLYSQRDVARLKTIKALLDAGDAIGAVAGLSDDELEKRLKSVVQKSTRVTLLWAPRPALVC